MLDKLKRLKENLEYYCKRFEENNESGLRDYKNRELYACEYFNHADDAFEGGMNYGMYFAELDMLDEINKIIEEGK